MDRPLRVALASLLFLVSSSAANAAIITSWSLSDCDDQGCEGAKISLTVEDLPGDDMYLVTQGINFTMSPLDLTLNTVQAIGWKALKDVVSVTLSDDPGGNWGTSMIDSNVTGQGCGNSNGNGGNDMVCTPELDGGFPLGDLTTTTDGWSYWVYTVTAMGGVIAEDEQNYGFDFGPGNGRLISAVVPEPSAPLVFAMGALLVGFSLRKQLAQ